MPMFPINNGFASVRTLRNNITGPLQQQESKTGPNLPRFAAK
jgi:hypothetical protein